MKELRCGVRKELTKVEDGVLARAKKFARQSSCAFQMYETWLVSHTVLYSTVSLRGRASGYLYRCCVEISRKRSKYDQLPPGFISKASSLLLNVGNLGVRSKPLNKELYEQRGKCHLTLRFLFKEQVTHSVTTKNEY